MFLPIPLTPILLFVLISTLKTVNAQHPDRVKVVIKGEHISLSCHLISSLDTLVWIHKGDVIASYMEGTAIGFKDFSLTVNLNRSMSALMKNQIEYEDAGNYSCIQQSKYHAKDVETHDVTLMVQGIPILSVDKDRFKEGEPIFATCCAKYTSGLMDISNFTLSIGNDNLPLRYILSSDRTTKDNITSLCQTSMFQSKRSFHNKYLICRAFDKSNSFSSIKILVLYLPVVTIYPALKQWQVKEGEEANVICEANGNPIPEVYLQQKVSSSDWTTFNIETNTYQDNEANYKGLNVTLKINKGLRGFYRCMATNVIGSSFSEVNFIYAQAPDTFEWEMPTIITCVVVIAFLTGAVICTNRRQRSKRIKNKNVYHVQQLDNARSYPVSATDRVRSPWPSSSMLDTSHRSVDFGKDSSPVQDEGYIDMERRSEPFYSSYITSRSLDNDKRKKVHR